MRLSAKKAVKVFSITSAVVFATILLSWTSSKTFQSLQSGHGGHLQLVDSDGGDIIVNEKLIRNQRSAMSINPSVKNVSYYESDFVKMNKEPEIDLNDVFISVKTTSAFHKTRIQTLLNTWISLCKKQTYIFTDTDDPTLTKAMPDGHVINTKCKKSHYRKALCCKMAMEFDHFIHSNKRWFCHVDDDNYLNTDMLIQTLRKYDHRKKWYLGKPSLGHPLEILNRNAEGQKISFWFATGGAGFCISRTLGLEMLNHAGGGRLVTIGDNIRLPDDCVVGYIINYLLKVELTTINLFHSHLESQFRISNPKHHITFSYNGQNVARVKGFGLEEDPTRFKSIHCHLKPSATMCKNFSL